MPAKRPISNEALAVSQAWAGADPLIPLYVRLTTARLALDSACEIGRELGIEPGLLLRLGQARELVHVILRQTDQITDPLDDLTVFPDGT
jgi:hypothetical protein